MKAGENKTRSQPLDRCNISCALSVLIFPARLRFIYRLCGTFNENGLQHGGKSKSLVKFVIRIYRFDLRFYYNIHLLFFKHSINVRQIRNKGPILMCQGYHFIIFYTIFFFIYCSLIAFFSEKFWFPACEIVKSQPYSYFTFKSTYHYKLLILKRCSIHTILTK